MENLGPLSNEHVDQTRAQLRTLLVGEIILVPTAEGHPDAVLQGRYDGLMKLTVGGS